MRCEKVSVVGWPLLNRAGVKRARLRRIRQVAVSSDRDPLDLVTLQFDTRPSVLIERLTPTVPWSSLRIASAG